MSALPFDLYGDLIGKRWVHLARGPDTFDCYGLLLEISRRRGIVIADLPYSEALLLKGATIRDVITSCWVEAPIAPGAALVFADHGIPAHLGIAIDQDRFVHASAEYGAVLVNKLSARCPPYGKKLIGAYEHKSVHHAV